MMNEQTNQNNRSINICFASMSAYPLLAGEKTKSVEGPDVFQVLLAKELMKHNFNVTFITHNERGKPLEYIGGIEVINIRQDNYHLGKINTVLNIFRIWNAMRKAKVHIYIQSGWIAGFFSPFCKLMHKKYICHINSDAFVNRELIDRKIRGFNLSKFSITTIGYWLDIKLADAVIVQSEYQRVMLKKNFGRDGIVIKKPIPLTERGMPKKVRPPIVLWVGAMAEVKQPELFVKLAEAIPEARFQMIGGHYSNQKFYDKIKKASKRISNFEFLGVIPFDEINEYFSKASILVNTSLFEAYPPYAVIQAWMNFTPVVSLGDNSDEIIYRNNLGFHSKTFNQLVKDAKILLKDEQLREKMGKNARQYVEKEHGITDLVRRYIEVFDNPGGS